MLYFILVKRLAKLFKNNMWKLHGLLESVISDRGLVCSRVDKEVEWDVKNRDKVINSFLFTNKWTNRENKSGAGPVLKNISYYHLKSTIIEN